MASRSSQQSWHEIRDSLRKWREDNVRRSEEIVEMWTEVLCHYTHRLGDEIWLIYEQVCIAAFDSYRLDVANRCLRSLDNQFPSSLRVFKLKAMKCELLGRYQEALGIYDEIIALDESNSMARKRKIAVLKSENMKIEAIKELNDYLKKFMSDQEAWQELCDLYIQESDFAKAAFCMEELILFNPHNHLFMQKYADIKYTAGGQENMELARSYYCQALNLNRNNLRALLGLFMAASNLASSPKTTAVKKDQNMTYISWAAKELNQRYKVNITSDDDKVKVLEGMIKSLKAS